MSKGQIEMKVGQLAEATGDGVQALTPNLDLKGAGSGLNVECKTGGGYESIRPTRP